MPAARAWIDTSALLALASPRDQHHARAVHLLNAHQRAGVRWVGSVLVLDEFHRAILYRGGPAPARSAINALLNDPAIEWMDVPARLAMDATAAWLERYADQAFSLTDAVSFELMTRERISDAFAFDRHYLIAGFRLLR